MSGWHDIWHLQVSLGEKVLRALIVYVVLIVALRVFGKRELGQTNTFDFIVLMMVANAVQNGIIGEDNSVTGAIVGAVVLFGANWIVRAVAYRSSLFSRATEGTPTTLMSKGRVDARALRQELISLPALRAIARGQGYENLGEVREAILEVDGTVSMFGQAEATKYHPDYGSQTKPQNSTQPT
jgi:uncharacterized membrane protein YcaP (DUF421 family)